MLVLVLVAVFMCAGLFMPGLAGAGDLDPTDTPGPTMKTLNEIYDKLVPLENIAKTNRCMKLGYRFCDQGDGTVLDTDTGLVWLKDATCLGRRVWNSAKGEAAALIDGQCGLSDGSQAGEWRLPSKEEWEAFVDTNYTNPALSSALGTGHWSQGDAFDNVQYNLAYYWSSTPDQ